ncbi:MAG: VOC family protein [Dictyoglomus sp.]|nr:VOC family protein [Dictyoglomus sp.]MCX7941514.1 VOC family protein [Dictyoglomaceae bacterium]MDW8187906.1 VOC family protein [Dictyoglomus sp.]
MIKGIGHIALEVSDLEKSLNFYEKVLGFKKLFNLEKDGKLILVYLKIAEDQYLELFPKKEIVQKENQNFMHICLITDNIFETVEKIKSKGWHIDIEPSLGIDGNYQAWIRDPDGNKIEIMQMLPDSLQKRSENLC